MASKTSMWTAPLRPLGRVGESLVDRVLCVAGAVGLSQAPEFFQQYLQRLGGHLDEAKMRVAQYEAVAQQSGITLRQLIETTKAQPVEPVAKLGRVIDDAETRMQSLAAAETALREASLWERPFVFMANLDMDIASGTWAVFKPAVPVTLEGLVYAAVGMVLALVIYQGAIVAPCRAIARRRRPDWGKPPEKNPNEVNLVLPRKESAPPDAGAKVTSKTDPAVQPPGAEERRRVQPPLPPPAPTSKPRPPEGGP